MLLECSEKEATLARPACSPEWRTCPFGSKESLLLLHFSCRRASASFQKRDDSPAEAFLRGECGAITTPSPLPYRLLPLTPAAAPANIRTRLEFLIVTCSSIPSFTLIQLQRSQQQTSARLANRRALKTTRPTSLQANHKYLVDRQGV